MQVAMPNGDANVDLHWLAVNKQDETGPCYSWTVEVRATKDIMPFEPLVRVAPQEEHYHLHQSLLFAKRGFMKTASVTNLQA